MTDEEVTGVRDMLYSLAHVIADAYADLQGIDQSTFTPPGDVIDLLYPTEELSNEQQ